MPRVLPNGYNATRSRTLRSLERIVTSRSSSSRSLLRTQAEDNRVKTLNARLGRVGQHALVHDGLQLALIVAVRRQVERAVRRVGGLLLRVQQLVQQRQAAPLELPAAPRRQLAVVGVQPAEELEVRAVLVGRERGGPAAVLAGRRRGRARVTARAAAPAASRARTTGTASRPPAPAPAPTARPPCPPSSAATSTTTASCGQARTLQ